MDRCHRIGQTRPVLVFRLATGNSIEVCAHLSQRQRFNLIIPPHACQPC